MTSSPRPARGQHRDSATVSGRSSFGAGPVSGLMTGNDHAAQLATVAAAHRRRRQLVRHRARATASGHVGSEPRPRARGTRRGRRRPRRDEGAHPAEKLRRVRRVLRPPVGRREPAAAAGAAGDAASTAQRDHNATAATNRRRSRRGRASASVVDAFRQLRDEGLVQHLGLTGTGHPAALREVIRSGAFDTLQVPFNLLNPSAGRPRRPTARPTTATSSRIAPR